MNLLKSMNLHKCIIATLLLAVAAPAAAQQAPGRKSPGAVERGKVLTVDGERHLYGGEDPDWHFDIEPSRLDVEHLLNGVGREHYDALLDPEFVPADSANQWLSDDSRVILVHLNGEARVYPIRLMIRHQAVNDVVGGTPVLPVYCTHARISAVFERRVGGHVFTFGVSGYTYADPEVRDGMEVFLLWDRDTESLWWPMMNEAVSGPMIDASMSRLDRPQWEETTWGEARSAHPGALVLEPGQTVEPPEDFPRLGGNELRSVRQETVGGQ